MLSARTARLRLNVTCAHSVEEIDHALAIIKAGAAAIFDHDSSPAGQYFVKTKLSQPSPAARDPEACLRLWERSAELVGLD